MKHLNKKRLMGWTVPCALPVVLALLACGFSTVTVTDTAQASTTASCLKACHTAYRAGVAACLEEAEDSDDEDCEDSPTTCDTYTSCVARHKEVRSDCIALCSGTHN